MGVVGRHIDVVGHANLIALFGPVAGKDLLGLVEKALGVVFLSVNDNAGVTCIQVILLEPGGAFGGILALYKYIQ